MRRRALLMGGKVVPNTIIGGIGGTVNTKTLLATKLRISESIIKGFEVVGSDVHCRITSDYSVKVEAFNGDSSVTKFIDYDEHCQLFDTNCFQATPNLKNVYAPQAQIENGALGSVSGSNVSNDEFGYEYIFKKSYIGGLSAFRLTKFATFTALNLTTFNQGYTFAGNAVLQKLNAPLLTNITHHALQGCSFLTDFTHSNIVSIAGFGMDRCIRIPYLHFNSLTTITGQYALRDLNACTEIVAPLLESIPDKDAFFRNWTSCNLIEMKKLKTFGDASAVSNAFQNLKTGCLIQVHEDLATANAGNPDEALVWVKANRGATVEFYDDDGNYVSTL